MNVLDEDGVQVFNREKGSRAEKGITRTALPSEYTLADVGRSSHPASFISSNERHTRALLPSAPCHWYANPVMT